MNHFDFIRRSQLITPARSEKMITKALEVNCDSLIIDLEDAIAPGFKKEARQVLCRSLANVHSDGKRELCVRINSLDSPWCLDDLLALDGLSIDSVVVPKVHTPEDLFAYDRLLNQLELRGGRKGITLQALIESASGLEHACAIGRASRRCRALIFGVGDFMADTGMALTSAAMLGVRARVVTAAAASGLQAIDHVHPVVADLDGLRRVASESKAMGFAGRWAIHPHQVNPINTAFSPSAAEVAHAQRTIESFEAAQKIGEGAIAMNGELVDEAVLKIARRNIALAERSLPQSSPYAP